VDGLVADRDEDARDLAEIAATNRVVDSADLQETNSTLTGRS
jgi:hypothetical protein